ncbi:MAG TPA: serine/threonine-protein kinase [Thermoleophilaceae bacterium]|nr:serine/threonine-protein kinase [Thermoleophilaceae bacterium]
METAMAAEAASWGFEEGDEIAPGRSVLRVLGGGSRFEVMLVWDDRLFAIMVAKVIRPDQADSSKALRELSEEAAALERLAHPVLVRGFDAVLEGPHPHVLIEHLEGPTLRRLIRKGGPLGLEQLLPLAAHVAAALHYMHEEGWVHLDTKPDNIVMGVPPRLIDLSIARTVADAASLTGPIGTDAYMPPEQCAPERFPGQVGPASDVWGLGATLYHAVSGSRPFPRPRGAGDSEDREVRFPQLVHEPEYLVDAPAALRELVEAMLEPDPAERPTAAQAALALQPLVAALPRKLSFGRMGTRLR